MGSGCRRTPEAVTVQARGVEVTTMQHFFRTIVRTIERMNAQEYVLVFGAVILIGFFCLRGFGSRSRY